MSNKEACEVFIEQQIQEGLESGKKPYSIGKELSTWIERLFETYIPQKTIEKRAQRQAGKIKTNVFKKTEPDSAPEIKTEVYYNPADDCNSEKPENKKATNKKTEESTALGLAEMAIYQLSMIRSDDPNRIEAFENVEEWILQNK